MAATRSRPDKQNIKSVTPRSLLYTDLTNELVYFSPPSGADYVLKWDDGTSDLVWLDTSSLINIYNNDGTITGTRLVSTADALTFEFNDGTVNSSIVLDSSTTLNSTSSAGSSAITQTPTLASFVVNDVATDVGSGVNISANVARLFAEHNTTGDNVMIDVSDQNGVISSTYSSFQGLKYFVDYSANFTALSLVTKDYVDNAISLVPGAANLTFSGTSSPITLESSTGTDVTFIDGAGITLSQASNTLTISSSITQYTDELAQDAIGAMVLGTDTVALTYTDGTPSLEADVITQLSITSDGSGIKLVNDSATPGNLYYYGTDGTGTKGYFTLPSGDNIYNIDGTLTGNRVVTGDAYTLTFDFDNGAGASNLQTIGSAGTYFSAVDTTSSLSNYITAEPGYMTFASLDDASGETSTIELEPNGIAIQRFGLTDIQSMVMNSSGWFIQDDDVSQGMEYISDYSSYFATNPRSIPDVGYVNTLIAAFPSGTGAATRVAFWSASSTLSSNANLYWDDVNTRLGIGTNSPQKTLHVSGDMRLTALQSGNANSLMATSSTGDVVGLTSTTTGAIPAWDGSKWVGNYNSVLEISNTQAKLGNSSQYPNALIPSVSYYNTYNYGDAWFTRIAAMSLTKSVGNYMPELEVSEFSDVLVAANARYGVTFSDGLSRANIFQYNNSGNWTGTAAGAWDTVTIDLLSKGYYNSNGITYPDGWVYVIFYSTITAADILVRMMDRNGIWYTSTIVESLSTSNVPGYKYYRVKSPNVGNFVTKIEISLLNPPSTTFRVAGIRYLPTREYPFPLYARTDEIGQDLYGNYAWKNTSNVISHKIYAGGDAYLGVLGNVGIGLSTASSLTQKLHVSGNMRLTGSFYDGTNSAGTSGYLLSSTSGSTQWTSPASIISAGGGTTGTGSANRFTLWNGTSTQTSSPSFTFNGALMIVGDGTTHSKLSVKNVSTSTNFAGTGLEDNLFLQNSNNTNNNWSGISSNASGGGIDAGIGFQHINHGSLYADIAFYNRGSSGFYENMRIGADRSIKFNALTGSGTRIATLSSTGVLDAFTATNQRVFYGNTTQGVTQDSSFIFNDTTKLLTVGNYTYSAGLNILGAFNVNIGAYTPTTGTNSVATIQAGPNGTGINNVALYGLRVIPQLTNSGVETGNSNYGLQASVNNAAPTSMIIAAGGNFGGSNTSPNLQQFYGVYGRIDEKTSSVTNLASRAALRFDMVKSDTGAGIDGHYGTAINANCNDFSTGGRWLQGSGITVGVGNAKIATGISVSLSNSRGIDNIGSGININHIVSGGSTVVDDSYGIKLAAATSGGAIITNYYGIQNTSTPPATTLNYGLYFSAAGWRNWMNGNLSLGPTDNNTARLYLSAGTATAGTAPLKFGSGTNMTTPEAGAMEWDGSRAYITQTTGPTRQTLAYLSDVTGAVATGVAQQIAFYTSTTAIGSSSGSGADTFLRNSGTGFIGIGTNPTSRFHVANHTSTTPYATFEGALGTSADVTSLDLSRSTGSGSLDLIQTHNGTGSNCIILQGNSTGDLFMRYAITAGVTYAQGIDTSDSSIFKFTTGSSPSAGTTLLTLNASNTNVGLRTNPHSTQNIYLSGSMKVDLGSDATGDIYYRDSSGNFVRLPVGSNGQVLTLASGIPSWAGAGGADGNGIYTGSGSLSGTTTVTQGTNALTFNGVGAASHLTYLELDPSTDTISIFSQDTSGATPIKGQVYINPTFVSIGIEDDAIPGIDAGYINFQPSSSSWAWGSHDITFDGGGITITDGAGSGMVYAADYSAGILANVRSIPDIFTVQENPIENYTHITSTTSPVNFAGVAPDYLINQGGTQATFTFSLPASPVDGEICKLSFANIVTTLTITAQGGVTILGAAATTAAVGTQLIYKYYTSLSAWLRIQ